MKKRFFILGATGVFAVALLGSINLNKQLYSARGTENLKIKLTADNVTNVSEVTNDGYAYSVEFDLKAKTPTLENNYEVDGVNVYAVTSLNVYTDVDATADGRMLDFEAGGYGYFQIPSQTYSNVSIQSVKLLASVNGAEKAEIDYGYTNNAEGGNWLVYFDNSGYSTPAFSSMVVYEINITYSCLM